MRVLEEGQLGARAPLLVGVEQVVDARVVLVDRLGGQTETEDARVEVEVPERVPGDRRDVVDAFESQGIWNNWVCGLENGSFRAPFVARSRTFRMSTPRPPSFVNTYPLYQYADQALARAGLGDRPHAAWRRS
jgi:hypothetical protein